MTRKRSLREKLEVARAELRGAKQVWRRSLTPEEFHEIAERPFSGEPARFVQIVAVGRGYSSILHALDADGQVWQQVTVLGDKIQGEPREVKDQWWQKVEMKRK